MKLTLHNIALVTAMLAAGLGLSAGAQAATNEDCGPLENAYGPYDYTNSIDRSTKLERVERAHFDRGVENLKGHQEKTNGRGQLAADIGYTLRAFPNHHRALYAMARLHIQKNNTRGGLMRYSPDCWFERAMRFRPADGTVYMIYGIYLSRTGSFEEALAQYRNAEQFLPDSSELAYNMGLLFVEMKDYASAGSYAVKAYGLGYPLPGLRKKLQRLGKWDSIDETASAKQ